MRRLLPLLLLALTACGTVKVAELDLPEGAWTVEGSNPRVWNRPIGFGPFRTQSVNEGSTRSWVVDAGILSAGRLERGTRLSIAGVEVECHTRQLLVGVSEVYVDPALGRSALLLCGMTQRDGRHSLLTLSRTGTSDAWLTGELRSPKADPLTIRSLHLAKGARFKSGDTLGFEISRHGTRVGVVETMNTGRVWIDPAERDQELLAAVSAALLLFRDPDAEFLN